MGDLDSAASESTSDATCDILLCVLSVCEVTACSGSCRSICMRARKNIFLPFYTEITIFMILVVVLFTHYLESNADV